MHVKIKIINTILCIALFMTSACSKDPLPDGTKESATAGGLSVKIVPEDPTAFMDIQASVTGKGAAQVAYQWEQNGKRLEGENSAYLSPHNRFVKGDRIAVTVSAEGRSASASVTIKNSIPAVASVLFMPEIIYRGIDISAEPKATDADNDYLRFRYRWVVNNEELSEDSAVLSGDRFRRGDKVFVKVIAYDSEGESQPFTSRTLVIPNGPPHFVSTPPLGFRGEMYSYQAVAEDPDGDILKYSLIASPKGMAIDASSGLLTLKIGREHAGTHAIEIAVEDPQGLKALQKYSLTLSIP